MKTINHTNGYPVFNRLKNSTKEEILKKYIVPTNEPYLYVDEHNRPFVQQPNQPKIMCSIKKTSLIDNGFHKD